MNRLYLAVAYAISVTKGLTLGLYILTYIWVISAVGSDLFAKQGLPGKTAGNACGWVYYGLLSLFELLVRLRAGEAMDRYGLRRTLTYSFLARTVFFLGLAGTIYCSSFTDAVAGLAVFLTISLVSSFAFGVNYATLEGTFEASLRGRIEGDRQTLRLFAGLQTAQHLASIGGAIIALLCVGKSVVKTEILTAPLLWLPYLFAAVACIAVILIARLLPPDRPVNVPADVRKNAAAVYRELPRLRRFAAVCGLQTLGFQMISSMIPLVILSGTPSILERCLVLAVGSFLPQAGGAVWRAWRGVSWASTPINDLWAAARRFCLFFAAATALLACMSLVWVGVAAPFIWVGVMGALMLTRFGHGQFYPISTALSTGLICEHPRGEELRATLQNYVERWRAVAGLAAFGFGLGATFLDGVLFSESVWDLLALLAASGVIAYSARRWMA